MADISEVINVTLFDEGAAADRDQMNNVAVITSQQGAGISTANRYAEYYDVDSVEEDFGSDSEMYDFAVSFFATNPNPINANGSFVAGYWRGATEAVAATSAVLESATLVEATAVSLMQVISDGSMLIDIDSSTETLSSLDFRSTTTMDEIATVIDTALSGGVATWDSDNLVFKITSSTTGATSLITVATEHTSGTFIGTILSLTAGSGAVATQGAALASLTAESKLVGITAINAAINIKGAVFIEAADDTDITALAGWGQTNDVLIYDVFASADDLVVEPTNIVWMNKLAGYTNYRMLFSAANNRKLAASYMARVHSVNFSSEDSALTMHLKELSVPAEDYTTAEITAAKKVGLDVYTTIKSTSVVLTSGANDFVDNRYNLIAFVDALETDLYNLLKLSTTKIPQTTTGVNQLTDQAEKTCREFVRAGVFAEGTWTSSNYFGDRDTFDRNIESNGFYVLAGKLSDQSTADREARKSPVLSIAVKNAGSINSADVLIYFNK